MTPVWLFGNQTITEGVYGQKGRDIHRLLKNVCLLQLRKYIISYFTIWNILILGLWYWEAKLDLYSLQIKYNEELMNCVQQLANFGRYVDCPTNKLNQANIYKDDENTKPRKNTKHSFC